MKTKYENTTDLRKINFAAARFSVFQVRKNWNSIGESKIPNLQSAMDFGFFRLAKMQANRCRDCRKWILSTKLEDNFTN